MNKSRLRQRSTRWAIWCMAMVAPLGAVCAATLNVGPSGADAGNCQSTPCLTIGYALTQAAASGDTVLLAAGTYTEQITIAKSVTIEGAGSASTIVRAPAVLAVNPVISPGSGGQQTAIVFATGASTSAVMRNLQIRGPGPSSSGSIGYGVFVGGNANFTLDTAHITAIRDEPLAGSQNGSGIRFGAPVTSQVGSGQVLNSVIDDFQKNGITVSNTGSNVTVRGNTITGTLPPPIIAQNGIQVSGGAVALIEDNTVSNLQCSTSNPNCGPTNAWSIGVLLSNADGTTAVLNNRIQGADGNLYVAGNGGQAYAISGNQISNGTYANVAATGITLNMVNNTLTGGPVGLMASGDTTATVVSLNGGNVITGASIDGIQAFADAAPVTVSGSRNQFVGNGAGASNPATPPGVTLDLPCNWWGAVTGPIHGDNPRGSGNAVTDNVAYINWAIDNTVFSCIGNPARNELLANPPAPVPANQAWALIVSAMALAGAGMGALRRRRAG